MQPKGTPLIRGEKVAVFQGATNVFQTKADWRQTFEEQLSGDGLLNAEENYQLEISPEKLRINGEVQSAATHEKYLNLLQESLGKPVGDQAVYFFNLKSNRRME